MYATLHDITQKKGALMKVRSSHPYAASLIWVVLIIMLIGFARLGRTRRFKFIRVMILRTLSGTELRGLPAGGVKFMMRRIARWLTVPNYAIAIYTHELRAPRSALANALELTHEVWSRG